MLLTKEELEVLDGMNCYENTLNLTKTEMDGEEEVYINNSDYWNTSFNKWFVDYFKERIYKFKINDKTTLYIFDNSDQNIYCDRYELLKKIFANYDIYDSESFDEVVVSLQDEIYKMKPSQREIELLEKIHVYDNLYDLAEEWHNEEHLEEYISHFGNLEYKFEDWFFDNEPKCKEIRSMYLYIDSDNMFIPDKKIDITNRLTDIFVKYNIYDMNEFEEFKNKYVGE